jgi:hypothetical protein
VNYGARLRWHFFAILVKKFGRPIFYSAVDVVWVAHS